MARTRGQTLGEILKEATAELKVLPREIAKPAGYTPQGIYYVMDDKVKTLPTPRRLMGLAKVLKLPAAEVLVAAGRSTGMRIGPIPKLAFRLPATIDKLDPDEQVQLRALIDAFISDCMRRRQP